MGENRSQVSQILVSSEFCMRQGHVSGMMNTCWEHELEMKPSGAEMGSATLPAMKGLEWDPPTFCGKSCTSVPHLHPPPLLLLETGL